MVIQAMDRIWIGITTVSVASRIEADNPGRHSLGMRAVSFQHCRRSTYRIQLLETFRPFMTPARRRE